jgi:predicted nucleotide-binding protein
LHLLSAQAPIERRPDLTKVFVVHGRNNPAKGAMYDFLKSLGLTPIEWGETGDTNPYVGELVDDALAAAQAIVVLMTGDDEARLREQLRRASDDGYESEMTPQARANVLFEAGLALGRYPNQTILVTLA